MTSDIITYQAVLCDLRLYNLEIKGIFQCNLTAFICQINFQNLLEILSNTSCCVSPFESIYIISRNKCIRLKTMASHFGVVNSHHVEGLSI